LYRTKARDGSYNNCYEVLGSTCTEDGPPQAIGGTTLWANQKGTIEQIVGQVTRKGRVLVAKLKSGDAISVPIIKAPAEVESPYNYFVLQLPWQTEGTFVVRRGGEVIGRRKIPVPGQR
jgi:hypothetical protein